MEGEVEGRVQRVVVGSGAGGGSDDNCDGILDEGNDRERMDSDDDDNEHTL